jgi:hypothetical protein
MGCILGNVDDDFVPEIVGSASPQYVKRESSPISVLTVLSAIQLA